MGLKWKTTLVVRWNMLLNSFFLAPRSKFFFSFFHFHYIRQLLFLLLPHFQLVPTMPKIKNLVQSRENDCFHQKMILLVILKQNRSICMLVFYRKWSIFNKNPIFRCKIDHFWRKIRLYFIDMIIFHQKWVNFE